MFKRGTKIEYTYAAGQKVTGKVIRHYTAREIEAHRKSHGDRAAELLPNWIVCELEDDHGKYRGACHVEQLRVI